MNESEKIALVYAVHYSFSRELILIACDVCIACRQVYLYSRFQDGAKWIALMLHVNNDA